MLRSSKTLLEPSPSRGILKLRNMDESSSSSPRSQLLRDIPVVFPADGRNGFPESSLRQHTRKRAEVAGMTASASDHNLPESRFHGPGGLLAPQQNGYALPTWISRTVGRIPKSADSQITAATHKSVDTGVNPYVRDVRRKIDSQRKELTAAQKEQMAEKILQCIGPAVYCFTPDGKVIHWTPAAERLFHWLESQALGEHVSRMSCAEETRALGAHIVHDVMGKGLPWEGLFRVQNMQGQAFEAMIITNPMHDSKGRFWGTVCIAHPILPFLHQPFNASGHAGFLSPPKGGHLSSSGQQCGIVSDLTESRKAPPSKSTSLACAFPAFRSSQAQVLPPHKLSPQSSLIIQTCEPSRKRRLEDVDEDIVVPGAGKSTVEVIGPVEREHDMLPGSLRVWVEKQRECRDIASGQLCHPSSQLKRVSGPQMPSWHIPWENLELGKVLGDGLSGTVFKAQWQGLDVAVKTFHHSYLSRELIGEFRKEVSIMESLRHPNVLLFLGASETRPRLCIVSELMTRGSVFGILRTSGAKNLSLSWRLRMALDAAKGMQYLHSLDPPVIHHDLKSPNLLVDSDWRVKVADFGLSKIKYAAQMSAKSGRGTPQWTAPEVLRTESAGEKSDVFSFGVILWELATLRAPWEGLNPMQVVGAVGFMGKTLEVPNDLDKELRELIHRCWHSNPDERPSFQDASRVLEDLVMRLSLTNTISTQSG